MVSSNLYLVIMLGVIFLITAVSVPSLFRKKCPRCGAKNWIEAKVCKKCGVAFQE